MVTTTVKKIFKKLEKVEKKYEYRSVSMGTHGYPSKIIEYRKKGWEDCTPEEIKKYLSPIYKRSLTSFRLMRREVA